MAAYDGILKDGAQPSYFFIFDRAATHIDINIHPTKTEVKV
jgi:DNA mismatch repair protein MutL